MQVPIEVIDQIKKSFPEEYHNKKFYRAFYFTQNLRIKECLENPDFKKLDYKSKARLFLYRFVNIYTYGYKEYKCLPAFLIIYYSIRYYYSRRSIKTEHIDQLFDKLRQWNNSFGMDLTMKEIYEMPEDDLTKLNFL